jgi:hypothetical protein
MAIRAQNTRRVENAAKRKYFAGGTAGARVAGAIVAVAAVAVGMYLLKKNVLSSTTYPANEPIRIGLADPPAWLPGDLAQNISGNICLALPEKDRLEDDFIRDIFNAASSNPWISKVHRVTRQNNGDFFVSADFRRPFAMVAFTPLSPLDLRIVDREGVVLPLAPNIPNAEEFVKIIEITTPPPAAGEKWNSPQLADALRLLELIVSRPYVRQINPIEINIVAGQTNLNMYALWGVGRRTRIIFGRFPVDDLDYEVSPEVKINGLDAVVFDNGGRFDRILEIDLRHDEPHIRRSN